MNLTAGIHECACLKVRTAARAVTRVYDDAFRPVGLRATQLSVLVAVASSARPLAVRQFQVIAVNACHITVAGGPGDGDAGRGTLARTAAATVWIARHA